MNGISSTFACFVMAAELPQSSCGNMLGREVEVFHHLITWPRGSELIDSDSGSFVAGPPAPAESRCGLYRDALL